MSISEHRLLLKAGMVLYFLHLLLPFSAIRYGGPGGRGLVVSAGWEYLAGICQTSPVLLLLWPGGWTHILMPTAAVLTARGHRPRVAAAMAVASVCDTAWLGYLCAHSKQVAELRLTLFGVPPAVVALALSAAVVTSAAVARVRRPAVPEA